MNFLLKVSNGQIIGTSEMVGSEASRDHDVTSVVANFQTILLKDLSV